jgi:phosphate/sulfate permease
MTEKIKSKQSSLRTTALTTLLVGTIGSLYFMFKAGSNQKSIILLGLFTSWVISPFVGLILATGLAKHWTKNTNLWLYITMLGMTVFP